MASVNKSTSKTSHEYGIKVPASVTEAIDLDLKDRNTHWQDAISKEMRNVCVSFEILDYSQSTPIRWTQSSGHLVFNVKMNFTQKARWVKDGHKTPQPQKST